MYHTEYNELLKELNALLAIPDADKDDDIREDIKSISRILATEFPDSCLDGTCDF